jgi:hypothetical protein
MQRLVTLLAFVSVIASVSSCQDNGQTGSIGKGCSQAECTANAQAWLASLNPARPYTPTFSESHCRPPDLGPARSDTRPTIYCECVESDGGQSFVIAKPPADLPCAARGRGGFCLVTNDELTECDLADPRSCDETCANIERVYAEDAKKTFAGQLLSVECFPPAGSCELTATVNGRCYASDSSGFMEESSTGCGN